MAFAKLKLILSIRKSRWLLPFGKVKMGYIFFFTSASNKNRLNRNCTCTIIWL